MSRTRNAALGSAFAYAQYALAILSGFVLFPLIVWHIGAHDYGLWLMTGELVGYLLLGDLGVFAILPWLVAAKQGAGDHVGIGQDLSDSLAVGLVVGTVFVGAACAVWCVDVESIGVNQGDWEKLRGPLTLILVLTGVGFPLRAFGGILIGLQDVVFGGVCALVVAILTVGLTAGLVLSGSGLMGLAIASGVPPVLSGVAAGGRFFTNHRENIGGLHWPTWRGCRFLIAQGFGAWLGGLGTRLLTASNALVFAALGRPDWATIYAATGKVAQVIQPACQTLPDSGLVGLSQLAGAGELQRTQRAVLCLILLYLLIPGIAAVGLLVANPGFVRVWLGSDLYASNYISGLIAVNLVIATAAGGMFKVVGVIGYRIRVGVMAIIAGVVSVGLGYGLGSSRGLDGVAEATALTSTVVLFPFGLYMLCRVYGIEIRELLATVLGPWVARSVALLVLAWWVGGLLAPGPLVVTISMAAVFGVAYLLAVRPLIDRAPWPDQVRRWLIRLWFAR